MLAACSSVNRPCSSVNWPCSSVNRPCERITRTYLNCHMHSASVSSHKYVSVIRSPPCWGCGGALVSAATAPTSTKEFGRDGWEMPTLAGEACMESSRGIRDVERSCFRHASRCMVGRNKEHVPSTCSQRVFPMHVSSHMPVVSHLIYRLS